MKPERHVLALLFGIGLLGPAFGDDGDSDHLYSNDDFFEFLGSWDGDEDDVQEFLGSVPVLDDDRSVGQSDAEDGRRTDSDSD